MVGGEAAPPNGRREIASAPIKGEGKGEHHNTEERKGKHHHRREQHQSKGGWVCFAPAFICGMLRSLFFCGELLNWIRSLN